MKLIRQVSDPAWSYEGDEPYRFHVLNIVEAASEFGADQILPVLSALNRTAFGGVAPGKLLCIDYRATRNDARWDISVTLRETANDKITPYGVCEFSDYLPRVEAFPPVTVWHYPGYEFISFAPTSQVE